MGSPGTEHPPTFPEKTANSETGGAKCGARSNDADLEAVIAAWDELPLAMRTGILAMVRAAKGGDDGRVK